MSQQKPRAKKGGRSTKPTLITGFILNILFEFKDSYLVTKLSSLNYINYSHIVIYKLLNSIINSILVIYNIMVYTI